MGLGPYLEYRRIKASLTIQQVARTCIATENQVWRIENDWDQGIDLVLLAKLIKLYGIKNNELMARHHRYSVNLAMTTQRFYGLK